MARFSTGLRNALIGYYGLGVMMNGGIIRVYGGERPASPDDPPGTPELGRITTGGRVFIPDGDPYEAGLQVAVSSPGTLTGVGEWRLKGVAIGTPIWWRWCWSSADPLTPSQYYPRVDGLVGTELVLSLIQTTVSTDVMVEQFLFTLAMGT